MLCPFLWSIFVLINSDLINCQDNRIVQTKLGAIRGKTVITATGKEVEAFLGIPYAKPPMGELRYRSPEEPASWSHILNATEFSASCMQRTISLLKFVQGFDVLYLGTPISEDCLYINIWVPKPTPKNAHVLVFILGGGFALGSSNMVIHTGENFVGEENVIFVNFNYRVSSFGFLYFNHSDINGNVGLLDQLMALKWVQGNIASFGGDPNKVTLVGQSAGAISLGLHMISPLSKGLFHRVILQSGSAHFERAVTKHEIIEEKSLQLAEYAGCGNEPDLTEKIKCLRKMDAQVLLDNEPHDGYNILTFLPVIDGHFLSKHPDKYFEEGNYAKVDILGGVNRNEGTIFLVLFKPEIFNPLIKTIAPIRKDFMELITFARPQTKPNAVKDIAHYYIPERNEPDTPEYILKGCQSVSGNYLFKCGVFDTLELHALQDPTRKSFYLYHFTHTPQNSKIPDWVGSYHGLELSFVFGHILKPVNKPTIKDRELSLRMMRYWGNFIRTGDPNISPNSDQNLIKWPQYTAQNKEYLFMAPNNQTIGYNLLDKDCTFQHLMATLENKIKP